MSNEPVPLRPLKDREWKRIRRMVRFRGITDQEMNFRRVHSPRFDWGMKSDGYGELCHIPSTAFIEWWKDQGNVAYTFRYNYRVPQLNDAPIVRNGTCRTFREFFAILRDWLESMRAYLYERDDENENPIRWAS